MLPLVAGDKITSLWHIFTRSAKLETTYRWDDTTDLPSWHQVTGEVGACQGPARRSGWRRGAQEEDPGCFLPEMPPPQASSLHFYAISARYFSVKWITHGVTQVTQRVSKLPQPYWLACRQTSRVTKDTTLLLLHICCRVWVAKSQTAPWAEAESPARQCGHVTVVTRWRRIRWAWLQRQSRCESAESGGPESWETRRQKQLLVAQGRIVAAARG